MGNIREEKRAARLKVIKGHIKNAKETNTKLNKEYLIAKIMEMYNISRRVTKEDVDAMALISEMDE